MSRPVRVAVRAVLVHRDRLLLVNAFPPSRGSDLWCAPGGGVEAHSGLPENLVREVREETGLVVEVGAPCLVNEFHDAGRDFHQVELFFRCRLAEGAAGEGALDEGWRDPEGVVTRRRWVGREEMAGLRFRPLSLPALAWSEAGALCYDALEPLTE